MLSKNPLRQAKTLAAPNSVLAGNILSAATPTVQDLQRQLQTANHRIAHLEDRLAQLELAVYVAPNGDVEIYAANSLQLVAGLQVQIAASQAVTAENASGASLALQFGNLVVSASCKAAIEAGEFQVNTGQMKVNSGNATFSGVVNANTLIANSVVGASYTPGAGNIW